MPIRFPSRRKAGLLVAISLLLAVVVAPQLGTGLSAEQRLVRRVCQLLTRFHVSRQPIDDAVSSRLFDRYLQLLDPQKLYFVADDIERFGVDRERLDDQLNAGTLTFANETYQVCLERIRSAFGLAHRWIDAEHDYSVEETIAADSADLHWANDIAELEERWRLRIKYMLLEKQVQGNSLEEARNALHGEFQQLARSYEQSTHEDVREGYLSELAQCFDAHSAFLSMQSNEQFQIEMSLSLAGIGAQMQSQEGFATVTGIIPGGPAEKDGRLQPGDRVVAVAQGDGEFVQTTGMNLDRVVQLVRGEPGTVVRLRIERPSTGETRVFEIVRQEYELEAAMVKGEVVEAKERLGDRTGRIGIVDLPSFYRDFEKEFQGAQDFRSAAADLEVLLNDFEEQGVDAVIIDLRGNGGGSLAEAIDCSGLLLDLGPVVQVRDAEGQVEVYEDLWQGATYTGPLVVVCDRLSASASEIFAGAIHDYRRGVIVGDSTTYGKGTVQSVLPVGHRMFLSDRQSETAAVKLTVNQFFRANGESTQRRGVRSDIVLPSVLDVMEIGEEFTEGAMPFQEISPADFSPEEMVAPELLARLRELSSARLEQDPEFAELRARMQKFVEHRERQRIPISESGLNSEQLIQENERHMEENADLTDLNRPLFAATPYNDELLQITLDYVELLNGSPEHGHP